MSISNTNATGFDALLQIIHEADTDFARPQQEIIDNPLDDLAGAMEFALENPIEFPPLSQSVFPGDSVAIAIQPGLSNCKVLLLTLIERLLDTSIEPTDVTVVVTQETARVLDLNITNGADEEKQIQHPEGFHSVNFHVHNPTDDNAVSYLAANEDGDPVMINRVLYDADVVLPVGQQSASKPDDTSLNDCIYPAFSNAETLERFRAKKGSIKARNGEIRMANDHLGTFFAIQIVAGPANTTQRIFSGVRNLIFQDSQDATNEIWNLNQVDDAEMAVATIESNPRDQTWKDFANALIVANQIAVSDGPILIWSDISEKPGRSFKKACEAQFESATRSKLSRELQLVAGILAERGVYLHSKLPQSVVESLGIGYVAEAKDVSRMIAGQSSGVIIRDAHLCSVRTSFDN